MPPSHARPHLPQSWSSSSSSRSARSARSRPRTSKGSTRSSRESSANARRRRLGSSFSPHMFAAPTRTAEHMSYLSPEVDRPRRIAIGDRHRGARAARGEDVALPLLVTEDERPQCTRQHPRDVDASSTRDDTSDDTVERRRTTRARRGVWVPQRGRPRWHLTIAPRRAIAGSWLEHPSCAWSECREG